MRILVLVKVAGEDACNAPVIGQTSDKNESLIEFVRFVVKVSVGVGTAEVIIVMKNFHLREMLVLYVVVQD